MSGVSARVEAIFDELLPVMLATHTALAIGVLLLVGLQVGVVLCSLYMRPVRTWGQVLKLLLILFAALVICCITVWLLWQLERVQ